MIWYKDPAAAFGPKELHIFFPTRQMALPQQLNAMLRLCVYWSVAVALITRDPKYLVPIALAAVATFAINEAYVARGSPGAEAFRGGPACVPPTDSNPHMNVMLSDYTVDPGRAAACDVTDPAVQAAVVDRMPALPQDDPFADGRTDRQFYTMPVTTIPNDQEGYRNFLYSDVLKPTVKTQGGVVRPPFA
jgi:hypothetical protein